MALSSNYKGPLHQEGGGLCVFQPHRYGADPDGTSHGSQAGASGAGTDVSFGSGRAVCAVAYREELEKLGFVQSMSRKGEPHDNAVAENFFSCLKCELVYLTSYATRRQAQNSIFRYIEGFYNPVRPHSSIGWLSPMEYARQLKRQNVA